MSETIILLIIHFFIIILIVYLSYKNSFKNNENLINLRYDNKDEVAECCKCKNKDNCIHKPHYLTFDCEENINMAKGVLKDFYKLMYTNEEYNKIREKIDNETVETIESRFNKMIKFRELEEIKRQQEFEEKQQKDKFIVNKVLENMERVGLNKFLSTISMSSDKKNTIRKNNNIINQKEQKDTLKKPEAELEDIVDLGSVIPQGSEEDYEDSKTNLENPKVDLDDDKYSTVLSNPDPEIVPQPRIKEKDDESLEDVSQKPILRKPDAEKITKPAPTTIGQTIKFDLEDASVLN